MNRRTFLAALAAAPAAVAAPVPKADPNPELTRLYGTPVDPDKDCTFAVKGTALAVTLPAGDHTLTAEGTKRNAPRVLRDAPAGDFTATVRVEVTFAPDAAAPPDALDPGSGAGLLVWADDRNHVLVMRCHEALGRKRVTTGTELHGVVNGEDVNESGPPGPHAPAAVFLRLERAGGTIRGAVSPDGTNWQPAGEAEFPAALKVKVGVFAEHNTNRPVTATFDQFRVK
jgi:regulation of enolase protein 1 (concanavalin A-like superfamily)